MRHWSPTFAAGSSPRVMIARKVLSLMRRKSQTSAKVLMVVSAIEASERNIDRFNQPPIHATVEADGKAG